MKKLLTISIALLLAAAFAVPALAHGGHRGGQQVSYSVCGVADCTLTGLHTHSGYAYKAHYYGDGHDYHGYCAVADCTLTGYHAHDGGYCFGQTQNGGYHGCHGRG